MKSLCCSAICIPVAYHGDYFGDYFYTKNTTTITTKPRKRNSKRTWRVAGMAKSSGPYECVVVGGGICGLTTAYALQSNHNVHNMLLTESAPRVGGNILTMEKDDHLWEEGPNSFSPSPSLINLLVNCGLKDELMFGDPKAPRLVFWEGKLRPLPTTPNPCDILFFDLMSTYGKLRALAGVIGLRPPPPDKEESIEEFVRRNLGNEVFERLVEPFCSGVYAGDPSKLSIEAAFGRLSRLEKIGGSILGGVFKTITDKSKGSQKPPPPEVQIPKGQTVGSLRKGLSMIPAAIASRLDSKVKLQWKLVAVKKESEGCYKLTYETPDGITSIRTKTVVLTVPSYIASDMLQPLCESAADALSQFYYPPVIEVILSYPKSSLRSECLTEGQLNGFGQLHPRGQGVETLGTIYASSLFPDRAPSGRVLLVNFIGGATNPEVISKSDNDISEIVDNDLRKMLLKPDASKPTILGVRKWPKAIPQFMIGHLDRIETIRTAIKKSGLEGLFLGGNYIAGVALGRCVDSGYESAKEISLFLTN